ncbi:MAG TPA: hypothetical protein VNX21_01560, partial [Candidatus Thermoplasmatota archaeon]|nr:hypothetical protein [Candidatus Thermoplasmatota archaeon]
MNARRVATALAPYALLCAAALVASWRILTTPGIPYAVDLSGFFPLSPEAYERRFWPLWNIGGGMSTVQFLPALLFELPLLVLGRLAGFDMATHVKLRILLMLALSGCAMYALVRHYLAKRGVRPVVLLVAPLAPALLYMLNPWAVHRVFHYFLWVGYAMAPLVLLALERLVDRPSWRRGAVLALTYALSTTDPHNPPLLALLMAPLFLVRVVPLLWRDRAHAWAALRHTALAAGIYVALGLYWILPYLHNAAFNEAFGPVYVLSEQMISTLSRNGDLWNVLVLAHNYYPRAPIMPTDAFWAGAWTLAGVVLVHLALLGLLVKRDATMLAYGAIGAASIVLGMGNTPPFTDFYHWLIFGAPWGEGLSWLFRDPFRWGFFQVLAYGVLGGVGLGWLTQQLATTRLRLAAPAPAAFAVACALTFTLPAVIGYANGPYDPVQVPSEYHEANAWLAQTPEDVQVVWMPRMLGKTTWGGDRTLEYFDATSSARPALGPFRPHTEAYFGLVQDAAMAGGPVPELLARAGLDLVVYHADRAPDADATNLAALQAAGLVPVASAGGTPMDLLAISTAQPANTPATRFQLYGTRALNQTFVAPENVTRVDVKVLRVGHPGALEATFFTAQGAVVHRANVTVADDGIVAIPVAEGKLSPGETYAMRLRARSNASADRFEVSMYRVDAYPAGNLTAKVGTAAPARQDGDLWMRVHQRAEGFVRILRNPEPSPVVQVSPYAIATPSGLDAMGLVDSLPESPRSNATLLFLNSGGAARRTFERVDAGWVWVQGLDEGTLEAAVAFVPDASLVAPFQSVANADSKLGWARGTRGFTYDQWGWPLSLAALGHGQPRDLDNDKGLVYTSVHANLTVPLPGEGERVLLARVYSSPHGGALRFHLDDGSELRLRTVAPTPGFRWVEVGALGPEARALTLENAGGFQGVNLLAALPREAWAQAQQRAAERLAQTPILLASRAVDVAGLGPGRTALPGTGNLVAFTNGTLSFEAPVAAEYALALRLTPDSALAQNGTCVADCGATLEWRTIPLGRLEAGHHEVPLAANGTARL